MWYVAQWVSRAPPHHTLPAFLNLNGICSIKSSKDMIKISKWPFKSILPRRTESLILRYSEGWLYKLEENFHIPLWLLIRVSKPDDQRWSRGWFEQGYQRRFRERSEKFIKNELFCSEFNRAGKTAQRLQKGYSCSRASQPVIICIPE